MPLEARGKTVNSAAWPSESAQCGSGGRPSGSLYIHGMDIKPCQACWECQKRIRTGADRDECSWYTKLIEADAVVIATCALALICHPDKL